MFLQIQRNKKEYIKKPSIVNLKLCLQIPFLIQYCNHFFQKSALAYLKINITWAKLKSLKIFFYSTFDYNVMPFVTQNSSIDLSCSYVEFYLSIENVSQNSHIFKVFLYLCLVNTKKEVILQICLLKFVTAEISRNVPDETNLIQNQHSSTKITRNELLLRNQYKYHCCCCCWHLL